MFLLADFFFFRSVSAREQTLTHAYIPFQCLQNHGPSHVWSLIRNASKQIAPTIHTDTEYYTGQMLFVYKMLG